MAAEDPYAVSPREAEVLTLLSGHLSNAQIAAKLNISVRTVENHVSSLLRKYGAVDRRALAIAAMESAPASSVGKQAGLPVWNTTFVGRTHERDTVLAMLATARLLTLTGPGGVGKTRLAAVTADAAAPSFEDGAAFVDLVPVRDALVIQAVATALGVTERTSQSLDQAVIGRLRRGRRLLILDNCEHVLDAAAGFAARVLASCPGITILATSRERLGVPGERLVPLSPLPLASDAEAMFADRAAAADPGFIADPATVARICSRLDGMPLAIELAAARCASLGVSGLLIALDDALRLLAGGRGLDARHRSLRGVIGWSHDLLGEEEKLLFRRLAVFAGSFDIDAAAVIAAGDASVVADVLGRLTDRSLLGYQQAQGRWRMQETVRAFAAEQLAGIGELDEVQDRHLRWAADTAVRLWERPDGSRRDGFDAVAPDLRAALARCPPSAGVVPHRLARALGYLTYARRFLTEALEHFINAASRAPSAIEAAEDLRTAAHTGKAFGLGDRAFGLLLASAERARAAGDGSAEAVALADATVTGVLFTAGFAEPVPPERLSVLRHAAISAAGDQPAPEVATWLGLATAAVNIGQAPARHSPGLAEAAVDSAHATGDPVLISTNLELLIVAWAQEGEFRQARQLSRDRLNLLERLDRNRPYCAGEVLNTLHVAWLSAFAVGDLPEALRLVRLFTADDLLGAHPYRAMSRMILPLALMGRFDQVRSYAEAMWQAWQRAGSPPKVWLSAAASATALACGLSSDDGGFRRWRARARQSLGTAAGSTAYAWHIAAFEAFVDARVAAHTGRIADPSSLVRRAFAASSRGWLQAYAHAAAAELAVITALPDTAGVIASAAPAASQNDWAAACLARANGRLHRDPDSLRESVKLWEHLDASFESARTLELLSEP
jgi:predicted ATPase/DNA-binding CsgD family transcriptional regulator